MYVIGPHLSSLTHHQASSTARQASSTNIMAGRRGSSIVLQRKESTARASGKRIVTHLNFFASLT